MLWHKIPVQPSQTSNDKKAAGRDGSAFVQKAADFCRLTTEAQHHFFSRRNIPLPAPDFPRHKQGCFFQTFSLAASSAPERLCDLHYSEVSNPLTTSGNDKTPYHHLEVSKKKRKKKDPISFLSYEYGWTNEYYWEKNKTKQLKYEMCTRNVHRLICCALLCGWKCHSLQLHVFHSIPKGPETTCSLR